MKVRCAVLIDSLWVSGAMRHRGDTVEIESVQAQIMARRKEVLILNEPLPAAQASAETPRRPTLEQITVQK